MKILGKQLVAARGLLGWTQRQLATAADVHLETIFNWENGEHQPQDSTIKRVVAVVEERGVEFTNGGQPGVRFKARPGTAAEQGTAGD